MTAYSIHLPPGGSGDEHRPPAPIIVPDGFCWPAFLYGPAWCVAKRCWLALAVWSTGFAAVIAMLTFAPMPPALSFVIAELGVIAFGLEANGFQRRALERRGALVVDYVVADSDEQAERRFFENNPLGYSTAAAIPKITGRLQAEDTKTYPGLSLFGTGAPR